MADTDLSGPVDPSFIRAAHRFLQSVCMVEHLEMIAYHLNMYDPAAYVQFDMMSFNEKIIAYGSDWMQQNIITLRNDVS